MVKRNEFVDSWRGLFHVLLLIDHLPAVLLGLSSFVGGFFEPLGYVSVTEGFVFLSGYVSGMVYTRVRQAQGDRAMWRKALGRARDIYLTYVAAAVLLLLFSRAIPASAFYWEASSGLGAWSTSTMGLKIMLLLYQPSFLEILPMYGLLLLVTPAIIKQLDRRNYISVFCASLLVWVAAQYGLREKLLMLVPERFGLSCGYFDMFGWQLLFVVGLICGHRTYVSEKPWLVNYRRCSVLAYGMALLFFFLRHNLFGISIDRNSHWVDRASLGPIRLIDFLCVCLLVARFRSYLMPYIKWNGFVFLSKNSLQVFAFHLYPMYLIALFLKEPPSGSPWCQTGLILLCVGSLFLIAFLARLVRPWFLRISEDSGCRSPI